MIPKPSREWKESPDTKALLLYYENQLQQEQSDVLQSVRSGDLMKAAQAVARYDVIATTIGFLK